MPNNSAQDTYQKIQQGLGPINQPPDLCLSRIRWWINAQETQDKEIKPAGGRFTYDELYFERFDTPQKWNLRRRADPVQLRDGRRLVIMTNIPVTRPGRSRDPNLTMGVTLNDENRVILCHVRTESRLLRHVSVGSIQNSERIITVTPLAEPAGQNGLIGMDLQVIKDALLEAAKAAGMTSLAALLDKPAVAETPATPAAS